MRKDKLRETVRNAILVGSLVSVGMIPTCEASLIGFTSGWNQAEKKLADLNGDGKISSRERLSYRQKLVGGMNRPYVDSDGDGKISFWERTNLPVDVDRDGKISLSEISRSRQYLIRYEEDSLRLAHPRMTGPEFYAYLMEYHYRK